MEAAFKNKDKTEVLKRLEEYAHTLELECEDSLHRACAYGWVDVAGVIVTKYDVSPDIAEIFGSKLRPIHVAAKVGQIEAIEFLLLAGGDEEAEDVHGNTALHFAFQHKQWDTARYLMNTVTCDPGKRNVDGVAPLTIGLNNSTALDDPKITRQVISTYAELPHQRLITIPYQILQQLWAKNWNDEIIQLVKIETSKQSQGSYVPIPVTVAGEGNIELMKFLIKEADIEYLSTTDAIGDNLLLLALRNGHTETAYAIIAKAPNLAPVKNYKGECPVRFAARYNLIEMVKCLVQNGANPDEPDKNGNTPLMSALREKHLSMVEYLVRDLKCDLGYKNKEEGSPFADELTSCLYEKNEDRCMWLLSLTLETNDRAKVISMVPQNALNLACQNHMTSVIEILVLWYNCDPLQPNTIIGGQSVLHKVFERRDVEIASILLAHKNCRPNFHLKDGKTLLELAEGSSDLTSLLEQSNNPFVGQARKPVNVFVLGNPANGKTSLVKVLQACMNHEPLLGSLRTVSQPKHFTTGILPHKIQHKDFGSIVLYDCAGRQCYQSSLAAIIEKLIESSSSIFIIVVDVDQKKEEIVKELFRWTYFLNCVTGKSPRQSHVIVAGSRADHSTMNSWGFQNCCTSWINDEINDLIFGGGAMLDCRKLQSRGLSDLVSILSQSCANIRSENLFKLQFHHLSLYAYCMEKMADYMYFTVENLKRELNKQDNCFILSQGDEVLSDSLTLLHQKGLIIYLSNKEDNIDNNYVVLDLSLLLCNFVGRLFASSDDKHYIPLNINNGMIPFLHLEQFLPHDVEMVCLFLRQFSLATYTSIPDILFVPALAELDNLELDSLATRNDGYWFGMLTEFKQDYPHLHFIDHYLHVLQLEVMDIFIKDQITVMGSSSMTSSTDSFVSVSTGGIRWKDENEVECLFEILKDKKSFLFIIACPQGKEIDLVLCRSRLFKMTRCLRERFFKSCSLKIVDNLIPGTDLIQYPNVSFPNVCKSSLKKVYDAVLFKKDPVEFTVVAIIGTHTTEVAVDLKMKDLLYFDSYFDIPLNLLSELIKLQDKDIIPDRLKKELAVILTPLIIMNPHIVEMFEYLSNDITSILSDETPNELLADNLVERWTENSLTASKLRAILDQLTIFPSLDSGVNSGKIFCFVYASQFTVHRGTSLLWAPLGLLKVS